MHTGIWRTDIRSYGMFWVIFGVLQTLYLSGIPDATNRALSLFLATAPARG